MDAGYQLFATGQGAIAWDGCIGSLDTATQDVFLSSGYAKAFEKVYKAAASLYYLTKGDCRAVYVFFRRPIASLPFAAGVPEYAQWHDIISAEYAGPVIQCPPPDKKWFLAYFWDSFREYCTGNGIVCEFARLSPFYNTDEEFLRFAAARENRKIVYINLSADEHALWKGFSKGNKSSIKKAQRSGVTVEYTRAPQDLEAFFRLYCQTMERKEAKEFYFFDFDFFKGLLDSLPQSSCLFVARYKGAVIAASMFLYMAGCMHYYFSASDSQSLSLCPNNLMIFEAIRWAKQAGMRIVSLGGGYHNNGVDTLFSFKSSFSSCTAPFYTYARVHSPEKYDVLCRAYRDFQGGTATDEGFFPLYRR